MAGSMRTHFDHDADNSALVLPPDVHSPYPMLVLGDLDTGGPAVLIRPQLDDDERQVIHLDHVRFARELVEAAQQYHAEISTAFLRDAELLDVVENGDAA